jgi:hypothetical protein
VAKLYGKKPVGQIYQVFYLLALLFHRALDDFDALDLAILFQLDGDKINPPQDCTNRRRFFERVDCEIRNRASPENQRQVKEGRVKQLSFDRADVASDIHWTRFAALIGGRTPGIGAEIDRGTT